MAHSLKTRGYSSRRILQLPFVQDWRKARGAVHHRPLDQLHFVHASPHECGPGPLDHARGGITLAASILDREKYIYNYNKIPLSFTKSEFVCSLVFLIFSKDTIQILTELWILILNINSKWRWLNVWKLDKQTRYTHYKMWIKGIFNYVLVMHLTGNGVIVSTRNVSCIRGALTTRVTSARERAPLFRYSLIPPEFISNDFTPIFTCLFTFIKIGRDCK